MILRIAGVAIAAWLSAGAVAVASGGAVRFGVTPSVWWLVAAVIASAAVRRLFVPALAFVLLLPWLPLRVPAAFLAWTGPLAVWWWILIGAAALTLALVRRGWTPAAFRDPKRAPVAAGVCVFVLSLVAAQRVSPRLPAGDEPHYLVITQSLLLDHDLRIENNHERGDYRAYFPGDLRPDYLQRGSDGQIYSVHAPGLPAIVAPAFAAFGYPGVVVFLALLSALGASLAWSAAWRVTGSVAAAWFGWAAVVLSEPFFVQTFMVYPDAPAGAIVMLAIVTLLAAREASVGRLVATGAALAILPWLHTRAAFLAAALAIALALRQQGSGAVKRVAALAAVPAVSALAWFAFFYAIYGTPDPRAPYGGAQQMSLASLPRGIVGLLFDQQFGILPNAPIYLCVAFGFVPLARRAPRVAIEIIGILAPYAIAVAAFQMWWAGYTTPARFLVPTLLPLAIPAAAWFDAARGRVPRVAGAAALALSVLVTATVAFVDRGALLLNFRDGSSRLLAWLSPVVDLATGAPSLFRSEPTAVVAQAIVWLLAIAAAVWITAAVARSWPSAERVVMVFGVAAAATAMTALTIVWRTNRAAPLKSSAAAIELLRTFDADRRQVRMALTPFRPLRSRDLLSRVAIVDASPDREEPLAVVAHPPAATYALDVMLSRRASGRIAIALDRSMPPDWTFDVDAGAGTWSGRFVVPIASPTLSITADAALRPAIDRVALRAIDVPGSAHRLVGGEADQVARYGRALVFLLGGDADLEPQGAWIRGASAAQLAIVTDDHRPARVLVRTPPVANRVTLDGDGWHQELVLAAGETRTVDVPTPRVRIAPARGARPVDFEPGSTDRRLLGCWIEMK